MRFAAFIFAATFAAPANAMTEDDVIAIGFNVAIASTCKVQFGEADLFEAAFAAFRDMATSHLSMTGTEVAEMRSDLLDQEAPATPDETVRWMCDMIRAEIM